MKGDNLQRFLDARRVLLDEKAELEGRINQINEVLGGGHERTGKTNRHRFKNPISLREAVVRATTVKPLTKEEILEAVKALGCRFTSSNPLNCLGVIIYGKNPRFKNVNGRFSPVGPRDIKRRNRQKKD